MHIYISLLQTSVHPVAFYMHTDKLRNVSTRYPKLITQFEMDQLVTQSWKFGCKRALDSKLYKPKQVKICTDGTCLAQCIFCEQGKLYLPSCFRMQCACCSVLICAISTIQISTNLHFYPHGKMVLFTTMQKRDAFLVTMKHRWQKVIIMLFLYSLGA